MYATKLDQIIQEIKDYISKCGGSYSDWYVGITSDINSRLFGDHGVRKDGDQWIYSTAPSSSDARNIERYFIDTLGTDGGSGGGDYSSNIVYAYKKNPHTSP
jgi:hypothetical protein